MSTWLASERALGLHLELHPFDFHVPAPLRAVLGTSAPRFRSSKKAGVKFHLTGEFCTGLESTPSSQWCLTQFDIRQGVSTLSSLPTHDPQSEGAEGIFGICTHRMPPDLSEVPAAQFPGGLPPPDRASRSSQGEDLFSMAPPKWKRKDLSSM